MHATYRRLLSVLFYLVICYCVGHLEKHGYRGAWIGVVLLAVVVDCVLILRDSRFSRRGKLLRIAGLVAAMAAVVVLFKRPDVDWNPVVWTVLGVVLLVYFFAKVSERVLRTMVERREQQRTAGRREASQHPGSGIDAILSGTSTWQ